ncbi:MAG TPA: hypothetical protein VM123_19940 [archaeon]|nr:hypothetical protein [archaeon]
MKKLGRKNNRGGRPQSQINYEILEELCCIQCTGEEVASVLKIDYDTLNAVLKRDGHKSFSEYFEQKKGNGRASLRRRQWKAAMDGNTTMLIFLGKQYLNQSNKQDVGLTGQIMYKIEEAKKPKPETAR